MTLKYEWNPWQEQIILAAKKQLFRKPFRIEPEVFFASELLLERRGMNFFEAWDEIDEKLSCGHWREFGFMVFCDTISRVLGSKTAGSVSEALADFTFVDSLDSFMESSGSYRIMLLEQLSKNGYPEEEIKFFKDLFLCYDSNWHLPVRLYDKTLKQAVQNADLPAIIMFYDMLADPGEKLKYIYHALLNNEKYDSFLFLLERYGKIESLNPRALEYHFLRSSRSEEKRNFDHFYCTGFGKFDPLFWSKAVAGGRLDAVILTALECGVDPDWYIIDQRGYKISLRDFMHFLDEVADGFLKYLDQSSKSCRFWRSMLRAAEIFPRPAGCRTKDV